MNPQQRPIQLKAWQADQRAFVPLVCLNDLTNPALRIIQFTGVYDAKGNEIWEGDILYWRCYDPSDNQVHEAWHEVVFQNGAFGTLDGDYDLNTFSDTSSGDVVVGNVFENPQMMPQL